MDELKQDLTSLEELVSRLVQLLKSAHPDAIRRATQLSKSVRDKVSEMRLKM